MENIKLLQDILKYNRGHYISTGDYSVTGIIAPPRITALQKRHGKEAEPTFKSQIASFMGTAFHDRCEKMLHLANAACGGRYKLERSVVVPYLIQTSPETWDYRLIAGKFDVLKDNKHLTDIKTANVWKIIFDPNLEDWHAQQNLYAWLLRERGIKVETINILCFYKDWKQGDALRDKNYPQNQVVEYKLKMWTQKQQEDYLMDRMELHIAEEDTPDNELPACTREERWERHPNGQAVRYACMKTADAKRATRVFDTFNEAITYVKQAKGFTKDSVIEHRYAKRKRCEEYCGVNVFCNHYNEYCQLNAMGALNKIQSLREIL